MCVRISEIRQKTRWPKTVVFDIRLAASPPVKYQTSRSTKLYPFHPEMQEFPPGCAKL